MITGFFLGLALALAALASRAWFRVDEGHVAVLVRFGRAERVGATCRAPAARLSGVQVVLE